MRQSSPWNLIASGSHDAVKISVEESLQHDDRYRVIVRVGSFEAEIVCRVLDFIGVWLGMCSLEMGRGVDLQSDVEGVNGDHLRLTRDLGSGQLQIESMSPARSFIHVLNYSETSAVAFALSQVLSNLA